MMQTVSGLGIRVGICTIIDRSLGVTKTVANILELSPGWASQAVTGFEFTVANFDTISLTARPIVSFYQNNGTGGLPGTLLAGFVFNPVTIPSGSGEILTYSTTSGLFSIPTNDDVWAAVTYDNNGGATGATVAQLNDLGHLIFAPPTIGSTTGNFFLSNAAHNGFVSNPAGALYNFGGSPPGDFGWELLATTVPEPGSVALLSAFAITGLGAFGKRQLKNRSRA